jgi:tetratricopeptide (TPR) repeat protein
MTNCRAITHHRPGSGAVGLPRWVRSAGALALAVALVSAGAAAEKRSPGDWKALKEAKIAIGRDYKRGKFEAARDRLQKAIKTCKEAQCSAGVRARLYCDLGAVFAGGLQDEKLALLAFQAALQLKPDIALERAMAKGQVQQLFEQARLEAAQIESPEAEKSEDTLPDVTHEPITEEEIGKTIPIYVEVSEKAEDLELEVHYRRAGDPDWQVAAMEPAGEGYGTTIPCESVAKGGTIEYYLRATRGNRTEAVSGSESEPHTLSLVAESSGPPPSYPGLAPSKACAAAGAKASKPVKAKARTEEPAEPSAAKTFWLQAMVMQDVSVVGGNDVCSYAGQNNSFYCLRDDGYQYIGTPVPGVEDKMPATPRLATTRVLAGMRIALGRLSLGGLAGYAFGGGWTPTGGSAFLPLHAEARGAFWLLGDAFAPQFGLYALLATGIAQVDTKAETWLEEDRTTPAPVDQPDKNAAQYRVVDVQHRAGRGFGALGAGAFLPLGSSIGLVGEVRAGFMFPAVALVISPALGLVYGL